MEIFGSKKLYCLHCSKELVGKSNKKFCNLSCAAKVNNKIRINPKPKRKNCKTCGKQNPRNSQIFCSRKCDIIYRLSNKSNNPKKVVPDKIILCKFCGNEIKNPHKKSQYCSQNCTNHFNLKAKLVDWVDETNTLHHSPRAIKKYLLRLYGHRCWKCEQSSWNSEPIPLELDHINGDSCNNTPSNVRLLCPNCHAQTSTYKAKNTGQGRAFRRHQYKDGKSY